MHVAVQSLRNGRAVVDAGGRCALVVMSIARLSAGTGYRYLLKNIARGDGAEHEQAGGSLSAYYAASGYPPGVWLGRGLAGVADGAGLAAGSAVSEEQMGRLFGAGRDPVTGLALGRPYRTPVDGGATPSPRCWRWRSGT
jgi:hypothetical protein